MPNIRLVIEYEGTNYRGWQKQDIQNSKLKTQNSKFPEAISSGCYGIGNIQKSPKLKTIQGVLEEALSKITEERIRVIGAGRTDAGVHALGQVANFKTRSKMTPEEFKKALNSMLPKDIVIKNAQRIKEKFHAQFDAKSKGYRYIIYQGPTLSPFLRNYAFYIPYRLNLKAMREGAKYLIGKYDFSSFQLSGSSARNPVRTITKLSITSQRSSELRALAPRDSFGMPNSELLSGELIFFNIEADGFLYGMVRSIVGTLIEAGREKISPLKIKEILKAHNRRLAGPTAPAKGLYLIKVRY